MSKVYPSSRQTSGFTSDAALSHPSRPSVVYRVVPPSPPEVDHTKNYYPIEGDYSDRDTLGAMKGVVGIGENSRPGRGLKTGSPSCYRGSGLDRLVVLAPHW